jgi:glyoxylase-like metal-dependent hydrolase (beta-lactamase superfamily II)
MRYTGLKNTCLLGLNGTFYRVNIYVIDKPDGLLLIDTGTESLYELLISKINEVFNSKQIIAVLLTHAHHAGAGSKFLEDGIAVYAPIGDKEIIKNGNKYPGISKQFIYTGYTPLRFLQNGDLYMD